MVKGTLRHARERLRQQGLARSGRADQKDVRFLNLDVGAAARQLDALVMLIDGDRQTLLRLFLTDDVFVQKAFDLAAASAAADA